MFGRPNAFKSGASALSAILLKVHTLGHYPCDATNNLSGSLFYLSLVHPPPPGIPEGTSRLSVGFALGLRRSSELWHGGAKAIEIQRNFQNS